MALTAAGAVLAAGMGRRLGGPKATVRLAGRTFVEIAVACLRAAGLEEIHVVLPQGLEAVAPAGVRVSKNADEASGPIGSLAAALAAGAARAECVVAHLVDMPGVRPETIRSLLEARRPEGTLFTLPVFDDGPGHPVLVHRGAYPLVRPDVAGGLKALLARHADRVVEVRLPGPKARDVDTPEALAALRRTRS